ncbi:unnamed protein product [Taenia asiatica]|uniref:Uncharacterized protein n=1 Tax=Taenia asiatica TaxID=60517 RepID=A0A0R3VVF4_TAEAS|nr:unnamed protein product [Taenia asiatica]
MDARVEELRLTLSARLIMPRRGRLTMPDLGCTLLHAMTTSWRGLCPISVQLDRKNQSTTGSDCNLEVCDWADPTLSKWKTEDSRRLIRAALKRRYVGVLPWQASPTPPQVGACAKGATRAVGREIAMASRDQHTFRQAPTE